MALPWKSLLPVLACGACALPPRTPTPPALLVSLQEDEHQDERGDEHGRHDPRLSDEAIGLQLDDVPARPRPLLEWGDPFLSNGPIRRGLELPTGAVLQPSLLVFGTGRLGAGRIDLGKSEITEVAARLDLFANLQLSGTERVLLGLRPLDQGGRFTTYTLEPRADDGLDHELNARVSTLFFEGDLGEVLPGLDPEEKKALDYGFAVGRQPLVIQEGLLIDDRVDAVGVTRNTLRPPGFSNLRLTGLIAWNELHRDDGSEDSSSLLLGLFAEGDRKKSTLSLDLAWLVDEGGDTDAAFVGAGAVQRVGHWNTAVRAVGSFPLHGETPEAGRGGVLLAEVSRNLTASEDLVYANAFYGLDEFSSASRAPEVGGPLGRVGILFGAVGLGRFPSPLSNEPDDSVGAAVGLQLFSDDARSQWILELGGREDMQSEEGQLGFAARYSQALGRHFVLRFDGFVTAEENDSPRSGVRTELVLKL